MMKRARLPPSSPAGGTLTTVACCAAAPPPSHSVSARAAPAVHHVDPEVPAEVLGLLPLVTGARRSTSPPRTASPSAPCPVLSAACFSPSPFRQVWSVPWTNVSAGSPVFDVAMSQYPCNHLATCRGSAIHKPNSARRTGPAVRPRGGSSCGVRGCVGHSAWPALAVRVSYVALCDGTRPQGTSQGWRSGPEHRPKRTAAAVRTEAATKAGAAESSGRPRTAPETSGHRAGRGRQRQTAPEHTTVNKER